MNETTSRRPRLRWLQRIAVFALLGVLLIVFHPIWLRWIALPLTHDVVPDHLEQVIVLDKSSRDPEVYDFVLDALERNAETKIVLLQHDNRVIRHGGVPTFEEVFHAEIEKRGVEKLPVTVVSYESNSSGNIAATIEDWLESNPATTVLLAGRFDGSLYWSMLHQHAKQDQPKASIERASIEVAGLPLLGIDETNWWKSATGIKCVLIGYIDNFHLKWKGRVDEPGRRWDPAEYEMWLKKNNPHLKKTPLERAA